MVLPEKKTYGYSERDENQPIVFNRELAKLKPEQIVYAPLAGMDNREDYGYGYSEKGKRFHALKPGCRQGRVNMIAAKCLNQLMAPFTLEGSRNIE